MDYNEDRLRDEELKNEDAERQKERVYMLFPRWCALFGAKIGSAVGGVIGTVVGRIGGMIDGDDA